MSKSLRIRTTPNGDDKYLKVNLEQDFDFIEILSLKISQKDVYRNYCADYGTVVGRVSINNGFGVPNVKVSIFIPIDDIDKEDAEIFKLYPFETITDKNYEGQRYNLLPNKGDLNDECYAPTGAFPTKRQILDNDPLLKVHKKYYKFTTTTNAAGDFMLFGVPLGQYYLHVDADMSDVGILSQKPYDFIRKGADKNEFESVSKFKTSKNLAQLSHIKSISPFGVEVRPFWGIEDNCDIGITRADIDLNYEVEPQAIFIGSMFTDDEKNSINKNCRARKKAGAMQELKTGTGRIEMIRKNNTGGVERFDVNDAEIDDHGVFAYQVPMNLDYMVTDEDGSLIPSGTAAKGLPTRASVRFRMSMGPDGNEGRLRTRAQYLIPNNPVSKTASDYEFSEKTKDESFFDMYWNKIYTVKNYIARYQPNRIENNRNFTGIKNVNDNKSNNPIPFNRMDKDFNPLFTILCLIISAIVFIISILNLVIITILNLVIAIINAIISVINAITGILRRIRDISINLGIDTIYPFSWLVVPPSIGSVPYIPCIALECKPQGYFAPGCVGWGLTAAEEIVGQTIDNEFCADMTGAIAPCRYIKCIIAQLIDALDVVEYDFYNDWLNGSLYFHLFKYKSKRRNGKEKFCEFDCEDFDGSSDNDCNRSYIVDLDGYGDVNTNLIKEGVVKNYEDNLYYASQFGNGKIFATDIVSLGAVLDCDWQGEPSIHHLFPETTMQIPPGIDDLDENKNIEESGQITLFFNATCIGIFDVEWQNIFKYCELGVGGDIDRTDDSGAAINNSVGTEDIENNYGRNVFAWLNRFKFFGNDLAVVDTSFGTGDYNGFTSNDSFYFYFGLHQGATALTKMQRKYFVPCPPPNKNDFQILGAVTHNSAFGGSTGSIDVTIIGGTSPYTYSWNSGQLTEDISGLLSGTYVLTVTDANGLNSTSAFVVSDPLGVTCSIDSSNLTAYQAGDGEINVTINNGTGNFNVKLNSTTVLTGVGNGTHTLSTTLVAGTYTVLVTDNGTGETCQKTTDITEPQDLTVTTEVSGSTCYGSSEGYLEIIVDGGTPPYTIVTAGPTITSTNEGYTVFNALPAGTYTTNVSDSAGDTASITSTITQPTQMSYTNSGTGFWTLYTSCRGSDDGAFNFRFNNAVNPYKLYISFDGGNSYTQTDAQGTTSLNSGTVYIKDKLPLGNLKLKAIDANGCEFESPTKYIGGPSTALSVQTFAAPCDIRYVSQRTYVNSSSQIVYCRTYKTTRRLWLSGKISGGYTNYKKIEWYGRSIADGGPFKRFATIANANSSARSVVNYSSDRANGVDLGVNPYNLYPSNYIRFNYSSHGYDFEIDQHESIEVFAIVYDLQSWQNWNDSHNCSVQTDTVSLGRLLRSRERCQTGSYPGADTGYLLGDPNC